jgi:nitrite reductase/ring-hydroxylating ferredoxin subunit/hemoglobin-like flavoprotein
MPRKLLAHFVIGRAIMPKADTNFNIEDKQGADDAGRYFKYMAEFVGFTADDAKIIRQTKPFLAIHIPEIVAAFYEKILRYPPTRKLFLKKDGTLDRDYLQLRMSHLTNFWLHTADGVFDDKFAGYIDYVGRAHTSHGADPSIYIAERYVIGQVGFIQHAISQAMANELQQMDADLSYNAVEAWDKLMMVILEMLARAYGREREVEQFDKLVPVDRADVEQMALQAFEDRIGRPTIEFREIKVGAVDDIPVGERRILNVDNTLSIGIFHLDSGWYAIKNSCLHRGGPVATGVMDCDVITCPWHGFQYDVKDGSLLVDPNSKLETYHITLERETVFVRVPYAVMPVPAARPMTAEEQHSEPADTETTAPEPAATAPAQELKPNEFRAGDIADGTCKTVVVNGDEVAVFNVDGAFHAVQAACTHAGGPLCEGTLNGQVVFCPVHGGGFNVTTGAVVKGPPKKPLQTFTVKVDGDVGSVS